MCYHFVLATNLWMANRGLALVAETGARFYRIGISRATSGQRTGFQSRALSNIGELSDQYATTRATRFLEKRL